MKKNILLVDDEKIFHFLNAKIISLISPDSEVKSVSDGKEAIEYLRENTTNGLPVPDAMFVDLDMPNMNGFDFVRAFNALKSSIGKDVILTILTSSFDEKEKALAESLGVTHYISKPLTEDHVRKIIGS